MRNYYQTITIACCMAMSASPLAIWAQSGDEQGLEIPATCNCNKTKTSFAKPTTVGGQPLKKNKEQRMSWYNEAKFGCFIHWGPYSVPAGLWKNKMQSGYTEHLMRKARIPLEEYKKELILPFNPTEFDAEEWMPCIGSRHEIFRHYCQASRRIRHVSIRCLSLRYSPFQISERSDGSIEQSR